MDYFTGGSGMIDYSKPIRFKDGTPAQVIALDAGAAWVTWGSEQTAYLFNADGYRARGFPPGVLENVSELVVSWHTAYKHGIYRWVGEEEARSDFLSNERARALLKVTYEPGNASVEIVEERK